MQAILDLTNHALSLHDQTKKNTMMRVIYLTLIHSHTGDKTCLANACKLYTEKTDCLTVPSDPSSIKSLSGYEPWERERVPLPAKPLSYKLQLFIGFYFSLPFLSLSLLGILFWFLLAALVYLFPIKMYNFGRINFFFLSPQTAQQANQIIKFRAFLADESCTTSATMLEFIIEH